MFAASAGLQYFMHFSNLGSALSEIPHASRSLIISSIRDPKAHGSQCTKCRCIGVNCFCGFLCSGMKFLAFINRISLAYAVIISQLQEFIDPAFVNLTIPFSKV